MSVESPWPGPAASGTVADCVIRGNTLLLELLLPLFLRGSPHTTLADRCNTDWTRA